MAVAPATYRRSKVEGKLTVALTMAFALGLAGLHTSIEPRQENSRVQGTRSKDPPTVNLSMLGASDETSAGNKGIT